ncbi:STAS domain-containing protein [Amycolatopsis sp. PS_44_ISF1]|uniref:STAS domain-containing protein n=1 Tax=Amycolatopsis sp. PS_44_ISF1 TaxID=2974917 RepID=UPI0028DFD173|nr:STAS domain-containing protein [Amycolatopsis sp. PS_44_ISF1]MDT8912510.1 STAS domain-containing protein [Amycolatopsis sp. PS_44_ISF1]
MLSERATVTEDLKTPSTTGAGRRWHPAIAVTVTATSGATVVKVSGEIDAAVSGELRERLSVELDVGPEALIAELAEVPFCDSSGLAVLLDTRTRAEESGVPFRIVTEQRALLRPISLLHLDAVLEVHPTLESALESLRPE